MNDVRQSAWWLRVFDCESFYNIVKQEWEATVGEKVPDTLNQLLAAILSDKAIVLPKIVANAYCTPVPKETTTTLSEWQTRHSKFNHDWLKNKFLNGFEAFVAQLKKPKPDVFRVSEFLSEDFPAWESHRRDAEWIVEAFEDNMSPRRLLDALPLNRCNNETHAWLGHLVDELWLFRYSVKHKVKESRNALMAVNLIYEQIASELQQSRPIELTKLTALYPQFYELKETYQVLSKTLSNLPQ